MKIIAIGYHPSHFQLIAAMELQGFKPMSDGLVRAIGLKMK